MRAQVLRYISQSIFLRRTRGLLFGLNLPSSIQSTNTTALHSSPIADLQTLPIPNSSCNPQASRVPTMLPQASTLNRLSHPRGRPVVSLGTIHSRLAALRACTGHVCEGSKWSRKTHLAARVRWMEVQEIKMGGSHADGWTDARSRNPTGPTMRSQQQQHQQQQQQPRTNSRS